MLLVLTGWGSTAAALSPQVTAVGLLGVALATTLPVLSMRLTAYVSPLPSATRTP